MLANDVVNASVFLRVGNSEVASDHIRKIDSILFKEGAVQAIFRLEVFADFWGNRFLVHERVAGNIVHRKKGRGRNQPHGDGALD